MSFTRKFKNVQFPTVGMSFRILIYTINNNNIIYLHFFILLKKLYFFIFNEQTTPLPNQNR